MKEMTIEELYGYLTSPEFQNVNAGNIFYNYYIYQYPAQREYDMRRQIEEFCERLERPASFVRPLVIDLFKEFCDFLRDSKFGNKSVFEVTLENDKSIPDTVTKELTTEANSDYFIRNIHSHIMEQITANDGYNKPYVFIHGVGKIYPYLRVSTFLTKYEPYNDTAKYRIIIFYPGHQEGNSFSLFDILEDTHPYRATLLVNNE